MKNLIQCLSYILILILLISIAYAGNLVVKDGVIQGTGAGNSYLAGNLGIKIVAPSTELHVVGNARISGLVNCNTIDTDVNGNLVCGTDEGGAGSMWNSTGADIHYNLGKVGIGTNNPGTNLTVQGHGPTLRIQSPGAGLHTYMEYFTDGAPPSLRSAYVGYPGDGFVDFYIRNEKPLGDIILEPNGNVGIGTTGPFRLLTISGNNNVHIGFNSTAPSGRSMTLLWDNQALPSLPGQLVFFDDSDGGTTPFRFDFINDNFIVKDGSVGIGTTNPKSKLQVEGGAINASGGLIIETRTSVPVSPADGQIWLRTDI